MECPFLSNQLVWCFYDSKESDHDNKWFPCLIIDPEFTGFRELKPPPKENERKVLWLGDGRQSAVPITYGYMQDFCAGFEMCFPNICNTPNYMQAVKLCVKLAAQRCNAKIDDNTWQAWAFAELKKKHSLTVSSSFYKALKEKVAEKRPSPPGGSELQDAHSKAAKIKIEVGTAEAISQSGSPFCSDLEYRNDVANACPVGWLAWYQSVNNDNKYLPCVIMDQKRISLPLPDEKVFITSLIKDEEADKCAENKSCSYRKFKVKKKRLLDFCSYFSEVFDSHADNRDKDSLMVKGVKAALQMICQWSGIPLMKESLMFKWAKQILPKFAPLVFPPSRLDKFYLHKAQPGQVTLHNDYISKKPSKLKLQKGFAVITKKKESLTQQVANKFKAKAKSAKHPKASGSKVQLHRRMIVSNSKYHRKQMGVKLPRNYEMNDEMLEMLKVPLLRGWTREIRDRLTVVVGKKKADIYYFPPAKDKVLRSGPDVQVYLDQNNIIDITAMENFTFREIRLNCQNEVYTNAARNSTATNFQGKKKKASKKVVEESKNEEAIQEMKDTDEGDHMEGAEVKDMQEGAGTGTGSADPMLADGDIVHECEQMNEPLQPAVFM